MNDKDYELHSKLVSFSEKFLGLATFIRENGTEINYEVQFVGGSYPVDTPHTSAGHLALELSDDMLDLLESSRFQELIVELEEAEARYVKEYNDAKRELDIR